MQPKLWFLSRSAQKVLELLRRSRRTVNELAAALGLSDNAVRALLAKLQRHRLIQPAGTRPTQRRPEMLYDLTSHAEHGFSSAYAPLLATLLEVLQQHLTPMQLEQALRDTGRRLASAHVPELAGLSTVQRAQRATQILAEMGGLSECQESENGVVIEGFGCPLAQLVESHPKSCIAAEALVGELVGVPMREDCRRGGGGDGNGTARPRCRFIPA
jgi:predicted ArsR family transcriptional regulator